MVGLHSQYIIFTCLLWCILAITRANTLTNNEISELETDPKPSLFKVHDEWLALPEVFSKLDFNANNTFADDHDISGQMKLRATRYWGRLYLDGWPQSIQYFQAYFGDSPPLGEKIFIFSNPVDACSSIQDAESITSDHVLLVHRGNCTFGSKARNIKASTNATALIVINNEAGLDHLPGPEAHDITNITVLSITMEEGRLIESYLQEHSPRSLTGYMIPINCNHHKPPCLPATVVEREYINNQTDGGFLHIYSKGLTNIKESIEYLLATFGTKVPSKDERYAITTVKPADACNNITSSGLTNKVILTRRGGCDFYTKASHVQEAGGKAIIIANLSPQLLRMGVEPRWKGLSIRIPIIMVSKASYSILVGESYADSLFSFEETRDVNSTVWASLEKLYNGEAWPRSDLFIKKKYEELIVQHGIFPDRVKLLDEALAKVLKATANISTGHQDEL